MTKRQLIDEIISINQTAEPGFLCHFPDGDLQEYLDHLQTARVPRMVGDAKRYDKYFVAERHTPPAEFGLGEPAVSTETDAAERAALLAPQPPAQVEAEADEPSAPAKLPEPAVAVAAVTTAVVVQATPQPAAVVAPSVPAEQAEADDSQAQTDDAESAAAHEAAPETGDTTEDAPAAEEPTTRRDSVSVRIARSWRQIPGDNIDDDLADAQPDDAAEDPAADDADTAQEPAAAAEPLDKEATESAELVPALAASAGKDQDADWLF